MDYIHSTNWKGSQLVLWMYALLELLGNPEKKLKFIHIAGTNGKGSTAAMLSYILREAGYKTGLYTSPYIQHFGERIQVNGASISDQDISELAEQIRICADKMEDAPTEFEIITVMSFLHFVRSECDIVVFEVGLGGRLDATNVIPVPEVAVITAIGLDHVAELGDTVEKIAVEKGGIIKPGGDVVLYPQAENILNVFRDICQSQNAQLTIANPDRISLKQSDVNGQSFDFDNIPLSIPLLGAYQLNNAATAITTVETLRQKGWDISDTALRDGLSKVKWPARFEILQTNPTFIVDGGHNLQCVEAIANNLQQYFPGKKVTFMIGVMADKDYKQMCLTILPFAESVITVTPDNPRALFASKLADCFVSLGFGRVTVCESVEQGLETALKTCGKDGVICALGSLYMAGSIRSYFGFN